ncbi:hypothetical protein DXG03_009636 [Asterophora parasitica]|uniref:Uncharacterized protein n=1 Tax=Asterophora parasitica TaxID=117018 RepID=A0A9P7G3Q0_9AGAR|nr:hypothetical protein DXG03_009636 [Asterophora parasitica]
MALLSTPGITPPFPVPAPGPTISTSSSCAPAADAATPESSSCLSSLDPASITLGVTSGVDVGCLLEGAGVVLLAGTSSETSTAGRESSPACTNLFLALMRSHWRTVSQQEDDGLEGALTTHPSMQCQQGTNVTGHLVWSSYSDTLCTASTSSSQITLLSLPSSSGLLFQTTHTW